jgi:excisionase family DNA binding protein
MAIIATQPQKQELLTAEETARLLRIDYQVLLRHVRAGTVPHYKFGRLYRFDAEQVKRHARHLPGESAERDKVAA